MAEVEQEMREAIRFHIEGLKADGLPVPQPTSIADYVEGVALAGCRPDCASLHPG